MTIDEIKATPEFQEILERNNYIRSFGSLFEFRINRKQPKGKIIKMTKYNNILDVETIRYFRKLTDAYLFFNKDESTNNPLEVKLHTIPCQWRYDKYSFSLEYVDNHFGKVLYALDIPKNENEIGFNISYWIDENNMIYKKLDSQDRIEKRVWQLNATGNKCMVFKTKTLSYETILSYKTERTLIINEDN